MKKTPPTSSRKLIAVINAVAAASSLCQPHSKISNLKMRTFLPAGLLARVLALFSILAASGIIHAQSWSLIGITGEQQDTTQTTPGTFDHPDHTLVKINTANGSCTDILLATFAPDSAALGYCATNGLIYHTGGDGAYRDDPTRTIIDQDPNVLIPGGAYQDNQFMETINLLTHAFHGVYNANPCPNPDNPDNDIGSDGLYLPCFGQVAPVPNWVMPQYRRDSTMTDSTNRIQGPNEPGALRGLAWSTERNSWYVTDGDSIFQMSADGVSCSNLSRLYTNTPAFVFDTATGTVTNTGDCKAIAFVNVGGVTKLLVGSRMDSLPSGNTNGWIMQVDPVTSAKIGQIALNYPPGGGDAGNGVDEFGGLLGLVQHPVTGAVYGIRKTGDHFARELVTIDLATGNTTLMGVLTNGIYGRHVSSLAFAPDILITSITRSGSTLTLTWTGAAQPTFSVQTTASLSPPVTWTTLASGLSGPSTTVLITSNRGFLRISKP